MVDRAWRGIIHRAHAERRKELRGLPKARIISRERYIDSSRGGPGYWSVLKLRAGAKGAGRVLGEADCWDDQLQSRLDELKQLAADLGYRVVTDEVPTVLECPA